MALELGADTTPVVDLLSKVDLNDDATIKDHIVPNFSLVVDKVLDVAANSTEAEKKSLALSLMKPLTKILKVHIIPTDRRSLTDLNFSKYSDDIRRILLAEDPSWVEMWAFSVNLAIVRPKVTLNLINKFLKLTEYAFLNLAKSKDVNVSSQPYKAWDHAIDIFASNPETLTPSKLIKLLLQPLAMYQSTMKIETWMTIVRKIGVLYPEVMLQIVEPFVMTMVTPKRSLPPLCQSFPDDCCRALVELLSLKTLRGSYGSLLASNFERIATLVGPGKSLADLCHAYEDYVLESKDLKMIVEYVNTIIKVSNNTEKDQSLNKFAGKLDLSGFDINDCIMALKTEGNWREANIEGLKFFMNDSVGSDRWSFFCRAYSKWLFDSSCDSDSDLELLSDCLNSAQEKQDLTEEQRQQVSIIIEEVVSSSKKNKVKLKLKPKNQSPAKVEEDSNNKKIRPGFKSAFQYRKAKAEEKLRVNSSPRCFPIDDSSINKGTSKSCPTTNNNNNNNNGPGPLRENVVVEKVSVVVIDTVPVGTVDTNSAPLVKPPPVDDKIVVVINECPADEKENSGVLSPAMPKKVPATPPVDRKAKTAKKLTPSKCSYFEEDASDLVFIPPKPKTTPLTAHQIERLSNAGAYIPALYQDLSQDTQTNSNSQLVIVAKSAEPVAASTPLTPSVHQSPQPPPPPPSSSSSGDADQQKVTNVAETPSSPLSSLVDSTRSVSSAKKLNFESNGIDDVISESVISVTINLTGEPSMNDSEMDTPGKKRTRRASSKLKQYMEEVKTTRASRKVSSSDSGPPPRKRRMALLPVLTSPGGATSWMDHEEDSFVQEKKLEDSGPAAPTGKKRGRSSMKKQSTVVSSSPSSLESWLKKPTPNVEESKDLDVSSTLVEVSSSSANETSFSENTDANVSEEASRSDCGSSKVSLESSDDTDIELIITSPKRRKLASIKEESSTDCEAVAEEVPSVGTESTAGNLKQCVEEVKTAEASRKASSSDSGPPPRKRRMALLPVLTSPGGTSSWMNHEEDSFIQENKLEVSHGLPPSPPQRDEDAESKETPKSESVVLQVEDESPPAPEVPVETGVDVKVEAEQTNDEDDNLIAPSPVKPTDETRERPRRCRAASLPVATRSSRIMNLAAAKGLGDEEAEAVKKQKNRPNLSDVPRLLSEVWPEGPGQDWTPYNPVDYVSPSRGLLKKVLDIVTPTPSPNTKKKVCFAEPPVNRGLLYVPNRQNGTGRVMQTESELDVTVQMTSSEILPDANPTPVSPPRPAVQSTKEQEEKLLLDAWSQTDSRMPSSGGQEIASSLRDIAASLLKIATTLEESSRRDVSDP